ncbi:MAG: FAD-dependent oxidoreductase [bacterium]|nr:FAD-dependent oxidoreductase [bacterium]
MRAILSSKKIIAKDTLLCVFSTTEDFVFQAGQYFFIEIPNPRYQDERGSRRHFSFVNSPGKGNIVEMATRTWGSAFKKCLQEMEPGEEVEISSVSGSFILPQDLSQKLCFIAGGIGITPFISMLRYLDQQEFPADVVLLYSNRTQGDAAFLEELQKLAQKRPSFRLVATMTEDSAWKGERRVIDTFFIQQHVPDASERAFYIVGAPGMVDAVQKEIESYLGKDLRIMIEHFSGY